MAYPSFVSPPTSKEFPDAIKFVEYEEAQPAECKYIKNKNPFILKCLASTSDEEILDKLMIVKFNHSTHEEIKEILLKRGIECQGNRYYFLGHSVEQLKSKTCYVISSTQEEIEAMLSQLTDFSRRISAADRASAIGALFSDYKFSLELEEKEFEFVDDPDHNSSSAGVCGFMSPSLSKQVQELGNLSHAPSAIRVFHQSCTGWLLRSDHLRDPVKVQLYNATKHLPPHPHPLLKHVLGVVDVGRPYTSGYLDTQAVLLLADKGVSEASLEALQKTYYDMLDRLQDETHGLFFLSMTGKEELRGKLQEVGLTEEVKEQLGIIKEEEIRKMRSISNCSYLRVLVPQAREVVGVADYCSQLKSDECFFDPTLTDGCPEQAEFKSATEVLLIPRPCYSPADVRVLKLAKETSGYEDLKDCLVLPTGLGRVQGNTYFVTWEANLIPGRSWNLQRVRAWWNKLPKLPSSCRNAQTQGISRSRSLSFTFKRLDSSRETGDEVRRGRQALVEYFASFKNFDELLCRAEELYKKFALLRGPSCKECGQLGSILSAGTNLSAERRKAEWLVTQLETNYSNASAGEEPASNEEDAAAGEAHREASLRVVERMEKSAREYVGKGFQKNR